MASNISNEYNMVKILQDIGANFFPDNLSEQRVGMFGFTCEALARIFGATILDANIRANEYHTITAKKMDTLLYDASILGLNIENTNPAEMVAYIIFNTKAMHREEFSNTYDPSPNHKTYYFIIEKDTNISIAGYNFMLEWDVLVTAKYNENEYVYTARYLSEGDEDPHDNDICSGRVYGKNPTLTNMTDRYIQGNIIKSGNDTYFMMKVNLRQMEKNYEYYTVTENDMISLTGIEFQYDDYLSHFNVFYRENQNADWEYITPISVYDTSEYTDKTIAYEIDRDSKTIILNATQFDMPYNSELRIDIYTTKGSNGNITYSGTGSDIVCELKSYDGNHVYNGIDIDCLPITSAMYGKDTPSLEEIRGKVIRAKASKNALSTEYDLYNFMKEHDLVNDYYFIKKRSDILEHIYGTFTIPRTTSGDIIPTSTMDIVIPNISDDSKSEYGLYRNEDIVSIKAGTPFIGVNDLSADEDIIDISDIDESIVSNKKFTITPTKNNTSNSKLYGLPYTLAYDTKNQISSLYLTSISRNVNMNIVDPSNNEFDAFEYISNFVIDHISISRNSYIGEDYYKIRVNVMANGDYSNCGDQYTINTGDFANALILKGFTYGKDISNPLVDPKEYVSSFFDFNFVSFSNGVFTFETDVMIKDSILMGTDTIKIFSNDSMYQINAVNVELENDEPVINDDNPINNIQVNELVGIDAYNLKIGIGVYYLRDMPDKTETPSIVFVRDENTNEIIKHQYSENEYPTLLLDDDGYPTFINGDIPYVLTNLYTNSSDLINLYTDMSYITRVASTTDINTNNENSKLIYFKDVPVLQYSKLSDENVSNRITEIISETKEYLDEMNMRLDDSFSIDYKFFRTYGPCQYFKLMTSSGESTDLTSLDISLEFNAIIKPGVTATDSDITNDLKTFLKSYVEKLNSEDDDYTIYMSNIITELETNFSNIIKSVELVNLNGEEDKYRIIQYDKPDLKSNLYINGQELLKNYVPEYINLPLENITINIIR